MNWTDLLANEKQQPYFKQILSFLAQAKQQGKTVYPPQADIFNAFKFTEFEHVKVVILGQDPYHGPNQAHGLCFSVNKGIPFPPSLRNIFNELNQDLGCTIPPHGNLEKWAKQGVLLLNTVMSVEQGKPQSHQGIGWETFTDRVIEQLSQHKSHLIFLLWGASAHKKTKIIDTNKHTILKSVHPSPLSAHRGFFGCKHFSQTNQILQQHNCPAIDWQID